MLTAEDYPISIADVFNLAGVTPLTSHRGNEKQKGFRILQKFY